jgi:hypothetical protein
MNAQKAESIDQLLEVFKLFGAEMKITPMHDNEKPDEQELRDTIAEVDRAGSKLAKLQIDYKGKTLFGLLILPC